MATGPAGRTSPVAIGGKAGCPPPSVPGRGGYLVPNTATIQTRPAPSTFTPTPIRLNPPLRMLARCGPLDIHKSSRAHALEPGPPCARFSPSERQPAIHGAESHVPRLECHSEPLAAI